MTALVVVPEGSRQGRQPFQNSGPDSFRRVPAVPLQVELAIQGLVDLFDQLAERLQEPGTTSWCFNLLRPPDQSCTLGGQGGFEFSTGVAVFGQDHLAGAIGEQTWPDREEVPGNLSLLDLGIGDHA